MSNCVRTQTETKLRLKLHNVVDWKTIICCIGAGSSISFLEEEQMARRSNRTSGD